MKKIKILFLSIAVLFVVSGCACSTWKSFTYDVETGDKIEIKLKTGNGYNISSSLPFKISKNDDVLSQGTFIFNEYFDEYVNKAKNNSDSTILEEKSKDGITYIFYNYKNEEFNYIIKIDNSKTAIVLGNNVSESSAREVFKRITITKK